MGIKFQLRLVTLVNQILLIYPLRETVEAMKQNRVYENPDVCVFPVLKKMFFDII